MNDPREYRRECNASVGGFQRRGSPFVSFGAQPGSRLKSVCALGGVALICMRLLSFSGLLAFWGGVGISLGGAGAAFSNVVLKKRAIQIAPAMLAAWQMIFGVIPLFILGFAVDGNPAHFHWSTMSIFCLLYLAVIGSSLTFLLLYWLLPRMSVTNLQTISLITPPGAVMLGWALGGEKFPLWSLLGAAVVLAGVWMIFRRTNDQSIAGSAVGTIFFTLALKHGNPTVVNVILNIQPLISTLGAFVIFGDRLAPRFFLYAAIAVLAGIFLSVEYPALIGVSFERAGLA